MTRQTIVGMTIDDSTKNKIDDYASKRSISRSAAMRLIINEFFLHDGGK